MRGKRAEITFYAGDTLTRDALGRTVRSVDPAGITVKGSAGVPSSQSTPPQGDAIALVVHVQASACPTLTGESWVEVTGTGALGLDGAYSISSTSGGRRIIRLALERRERRDGSHGRV